jgi:cysteine desulfurase
MLENTSLGRSTKVYLDHNATTPVAEKVILGLPFISRIWGNPSSIHWAGRGPKAIIREARQNLATALCVHPLEIIFTSGGSEANSTIIKGLFAVGQSLGKNEFITTQVEHPSVLKTFRALEQQGAVIHYLAVDRQGRLDVEKYQALLSERTMLVSVMYANNETGVIFPIEKMAKMAHDKGVLFHSDCVQALGKVTLNLEKLNVDYASFSAHKVYALKGCGAIFAKRGKPFNPLIEGGGQERHRRGGTENTMGVWAFGEMAKELARMPETYQQLTSLRDYFEEQVLQKIPLVQITSAEAFRLPNTSSLVLQGVDGETLLMSLDLKGFAVSTGAACSSGSPEPSPVLLAIGLSRKEAQNSLRVSLGWDTTEAQIDKFISVLSEVVARLRALPADVIKQPSEDFHVEL